jgi:YVTN family beta-propeller protein
MLNSLFGCDAVVNIGLTRRRGVRGDRFFLRALRVSACALYFSASLALARDPDSAPAPARWPGMKIGERIQLPNQWSLQPAGEQVELGDFPVNIALHPTEPYAAVLHCGYGAHEIVIVDLKNKKIAFRTREPELFYGLAWDANRSEFWASCGEFGKVSCIQFLNEKWQIGRVSHEIRLYEKPQGVLTGLASNGNTRMLLAANGWGHELAMVTFADISRSPIYQHGYDASRSVQQIALNAGSYPYAVLPSRDGKMAYVSLWGGGAVAVLDTAAKKIVATWPVGPTGVEKSTSHPTEIALSPDEKLLYVACSNGSSVFVLDTTTGQQIEEISTALYPGALAGSTPNSLALSPDGKVLLVANADNNNLAMFDVSRRGQSRSLGFIPVGWYPTSVRFSNDGKQIYVANGKGIKPMANPDGPNPLVKKQKGKPEQYIAGLLRGTLSIIDAPSPDDMARYTAQAHAASPLRSDLAAVTKPRETDNPIPAAVGRPSPIKHCIYIIKENRTYDQIFGDVKQGNGDPKLCIFGEKTTPNLHALVREFTLLDNFYAEAEVSADGHEWSTAAYATDFTEKTWPLNYRGSKFNRIEYPSDGHMAITNPLAGRIWDRCQESGVSYRSYGEFIDPGPKPDGPWHATVKALEGHFDPLFHGWDLDYPDAKRVDRFLAELREFEKAGTMPQFIVMRLPNDHTHGTAIGKPTPTAMVAENDLALGRFVEAVSQSKFWPETAIFVIEDDAQNGSDHVDAHRTEALVISPYTKRHAVDSTLYSTTSMLRTMELILGLKPLTQFDAAATPMYNAFQARADTTPYKHRPAEVDLAAKNLLNALGSEESSHLDFSREDAADEMTLNRVIWQSVRGAGSQMPPPVHAAFVRVSPQQADDDD